MDVFMLLFFPNTFICITMFHTDSIINCFILFYNVNNSLCINILIIHRNCLNTCMRKLSSACSFYQYGCIMYNNIINSANISLMAVFQKYLISATNHCFYNCIDNVKNILYIQYLELKCISMYRLLILIGYIYKFPKYSSPWSLLFTYVLNQLLCTDVLNQLLCTYKLTLICICLIRAEIWLQMFPRLYLLHCCQLINSNIICTLLFVEIESKYLMITKSWYPDIIQYACGMYTIFDRLVLNVIRCQPLCFLIRIIICILIIMICILVNYIPTGSAHFNIHIIGTLIFAERELKSIRLNELRFQNIILYHNAYITEFHILLSENIYLHILWSPNLVALCELFWTANIWLQLYTWLYILQHCKHWCTHVWLKIYYEPISILLRVCIIYIHHMSIIGKVLRMTILVLFHCIDVYNALAYNNCLIISHCIHLYYKHG